MNCFRQLFYDRWKISIYLIGAICLSFIYNVICTFEQNGDSVVFRDFSLWIRIGAGTVFILFWMILLEHVAYTCSNKFESRMNGKNGIMHIIVPFGLIFTILFISYLALYPGWLAYDGPGQIMTVMIEHQLDSHHPILHTLLMSGCVMLGQNLFQSATVGYGMYTFIQMLVVAWSLSLMFINLVRWTKRVGVVVVSYVLILCNPIFLNLVMTSTHDIIFGALFIVSIVYFVKLWEECNRGDIKRTTVGLLITFMILSGMFEKQGIYVYIIVLILGILSLKKMRKPLIVCLSIVVVAFFSITGPVYKAFGIVSDSSVEKISVPLLQMTRVVNEEGASISEEQLEEYYKFVPEDVSKNYIPYISDTIKDFMDKEYYEEHKSEFFLLWLKLGIQNPGIYVDAFLALTEGYFYPGGEGISDWGKLCDWRGSLTDQYSIEQQSVFPSLKMKITSVGTSFFEGNGLLSFWVSISFPFWVIAWFFIKAVANKDIKVVFVLLYCLGLFASLLLGPVSCIRYVFPLLMALPAVITLGWTSKMYKIER